MVDKTTGPCRAFLLLAPLMGAWAAWAGGSDLPAAAERPAATEDSATAERAFLRKAVAGTPYSALVVHTRVDIAPVRGGRSTPPGGSEAGGEERHTYHARVLETFRGHPQASIRYDMVVESGEAAQLDTQPQIVTLCKGPRGFYWPGVGASFPGHPDTVSQARRVARQRTADGPARFPHCD